MKTYLITTEEIRKVIRTYMVEARTEEEASAVFEFVDPDDCLTEKHDFGYEQEVHIELVG